MSSAYDNDPRVVKVNDHLYELPSPEGWTVEFNGRAWRGRDKYGSLVTSGYGDSLDATIADIIGPPQ